MSPLLPSSPADWQVEPVSCVSMDECVLVWFERGKIVFITVAGKRTSSFDLGPVTVASIYLFMSFSYWMCCVFVPLSSLLVDFCLYVTVLSLVVVIDFLLGLFLCHFLSVSRLTKFFWFWVIIYFLIGFFSGHLFSASQSIACLCFIVVTHPSWDCAFLCKSSEQSWKINWFWCWQFVGFTARGR